VQEGVFGEALWWEGRFHDAIAMSMLAPEWERQVGR
jgi:RimJ/RimL family protein N-acetyltransferase